MQINAYKGDFKVKKKKDQEIFTNSCAKNQYMALFFFLTSCLYFCGFAHIKYKAIPIKINKVVQAIGNNQFGGVIGGLLIKEYQELSPVSVKKEPTTPALKPINIDNINLR